MSTLGDKIRTALEQDTRIAAAWLYGSQARGDARPDSDIDIGILTNEKLTTMDLLELHDRLARALRCDDMDLKPLNEAGPALRFEAISGQRVLCRDPGATAVFESLTCREYEDVLATWERGLAYRRNLQRPAG